jgi:hypothetical protein
MTATFTATQRLVQRQLTTAAGIVLALVLAGVAVVFFLARRRRWHTTTWGRTSLGWGQLWVNDRRGSRSLRRNFGITLLLLFFVFFGFDGLFALFLFELFGVNLCTTKFTLFSAFFVIRITLCGVFDFAGLSKLQRLHPACHLDVRNTCGPLGRITAQRCRTAASWLWRTRLGHDNALALRFNYNVLGTPVAEALLHASGTGSNTKWLFAV